MSGVLTYDIGKHFPFFKVQNVIYNAKQWMVVLFKCKQTWWIRTVSLWLISLAEVTAFINWAQIWKLMILENRCKNKHKEIHIRQPTGLKCRHHNTTVTVASSSSFGWCQWLSFFLSLTPA